MSEDDFDNCTGALRLVFYGVIAIFSLLGGLFFFSIAMIVKGLLS